MKLVICNCIFGDGGYYMMIKSTQFMHLIFVATGHTKFGSFYSGTHMIISHIYDVLSYSITHL